MTTIQLMACIGMVVGFFVLLGITPSDFTEGVFRQITSKPKSLRDEINESTQRKKKFVLRREIEESQNILRMTGREAKFPAICAMSLLLFLVGASFAFLLGNFFLVPVLAAGMMFIPFWYIKLTAAYFKKAISAELETALSIITTSYLRNEDIQTAVEENLEYLNPPVKNAFAEFLTRIKLVDPDVDAALRDLSTKIDNAVFREWVAALLTCRYDRGMKTTLTPIVAKLSDMRIVNGDLENMVFEPRKEFIVMQILVLGNIPLLYFLNQEWYDILMHTPMGQIILAVCAAVLFVSTAAVIKLTQPIEYMVEGKPYVKLGGSIGRYPKFQPEDYVILRLKPRYQNGEWVRWMQEMPPGTPPELLKAAENFSNLKLGFRGDLKFWPEPEIIEVKALLAPEEIQSVNLSISM